MAGRLGGQKEQEWAVVWSGEVKAGKSETLKAPWWGLGTEHWKEMQWAKKMEVASACPKEAARERMWELVTAPWSVYLLGRWRVDQKAMMTVVRWGED